MVTINLTLLVELGLFLLFLWGTSRFILHPVLKTLDERDAHVEQNHADAGSAREAAASLEEQYAGELADVRRQAELTYRTKRRSAIETQTKQLVGKRHETDEAVAEVRASGAQQIEDQRGAYAALARELADSIARRIGMKGDAG